MKNKFFVVFFAIVTLIGLSACNSVPEIPDDMTAAQLLQAGQNAVNSANYKGAEAYFMAVITRYGLDNALYIEARYELGCIYLKKKKYDMAQTAFNEILGMYEDAMIGDLPPAFEKLAKIKLDRIPEQKKNKR